MFEKKGMNETTETIVYCLLGLLIAVSLNRGLAVAFGTPLPVVTVSSKSMVPTLKVGDISVIYGRGEYKVNDIIVFDGWEEEPIIHRIVGIAERNNSKISVKKSERLGLTETGLKKYAEVYFQNSDNDKIYITKGDNNPGPDQFRGNGGFQPVTESRIYGKSVFVIPYLGWVKLLAFRYIIHNTLGLVLTGVLILGFIIYKTL